MRVSIIIPTYQHADTLPACLEAVFAQTYPVYEVIVVDDGSTDHPEQAIEPFRSRVRFVRKDHQGGCAARNAGFALSTGDAVLFCDADLIMSSEMIEQLVAALAQHPEVAYAYSGFRFGWKTFSSFPFRAHRLREMNFIHTSALIRRDDFPGFDPAIRRFQDWDVWLTLLKRGKEGAYVNRELFHVLEARGRVGISKWRPALLYRLPWHLMPWKPLSVRAYEEARQVIWKKHNLV